MAKLQNLLTEPQTRTFNVAGVNIEVPMQYNYVAIDGTGQAWAFITHPSGPWDKECLSTTYWDIDTEIAECNEESIHIADFTELSYEDVLSVYLPKGEIK